MSVDTQSLQQLRCPEKLEQNDADYNKHLLNTVQKLLAIDTHQLTEIDLDSLDPYLDTLPYIFVLGAKIGNGFKKATADSWGAGGELSSSLTLILTQCNPIEIRYAGDRWRRLVQSMCDIAHYASTSIEASRSLGIVATAILRLDPAASTFTSLHHCLLESCLSTRCSQPALMILNKDIYNLPAKDFTSLNNQPICSKLLNSGDYITLSSGLTDRVKLSKVQQYYIYGAMIFVALQHWRQAKHFLDHVLLTPTQSVANALVVEAYKKWILVHLLVKDTEGEIPKLVNAQAFRNVRALAKAYESLASAFGLEEPQKLEAESTLGRKIWQSDGNLGLVDRVIEHHRRLYVLKFERVYATMPLDLMAAKLCLSIKKTKEYIDTLISENTLKATIDVNSQEVIIRFLDQEYLDNTHSERLLRDELVQRTNRIKLLTKHLDETDRRLSLTKEYVEHIRRGRKSKEERNSMDEEAMDMSLGPQGSDDDDFRADMMIDVQ